MKPCVLVVDDEPLLVETITYNLEKAGFTTLRAADGLAALSLARAAHPDFIVLDLMLPHLSGREVCRQLREEAGWGQSVPILMLSARSGKNEEERCCEVGANSYMTKPFSMSDLIGRVQEMLAQK